MSNRFYTAFGFGAYIYAKRFPTTLRFSRDRFVVDKSILGNTLGLFSGATAGIREVTPHTSERFKARGISPQELAIRTSGKDYTFGLGFTKPERDWVRQSINKWLRQTHHEP